MELVQLFQILTTLGAATLPTAGQGVTATCVEDNFSSGHLRVQVSRLSSGHCLASVAQNQGDLAFRSYFFSTTGLFLVTQSIEREMDVESGSRALFLLPRSEELAVGLNYDGEVHVRSPSGIVFRFSPETARLAGVEGAEFKEDPQVTMENYGGVELLKIERGLILDTGWARGGVAFHEPSRQSLFRDSENRYCVVNNTDVFAYESRSVQMKHDFDSDLFQFLGERCPALRLESR